MINVFVFYATQLHDINYMKIVQPQLRHLMCCILYAQYDIHKF